MTHNPRLFLGEFPLRNLRAKMAEKDDPFESLLFIEDRLQQQGYKDGHQHGLVEGKKEAFDAGRTNGRDVGCEIGYYYGFTETWLRLLKDKPGQERKMRALSTLHDKLRQFQVLNVNSTDYAKEFLQIQAKYRQVLALLKVPVLVKDNDDLAF